MAKEKEKKEKKPNFFKKAGSAIAGFFKGIVSEIKKVTWPTKKQVVSNTLSVLAFCLVVGAIIWLSDLGLDALMSLIVRLS
ncbi:MAG: preprotein translocase subunit SecE [Clostridia bacterium]|nr:preprotein translocase subunit SecE [Clostridia bacterium]